MNNTFSSNMLKIYEECPQKYKLIYEDKITLPQQTSQAETGKNIHALINYYFKGFDITKLTATLDTDTKILWQNFLNLGIKKEDIFKSEYQFNVKINDKFWLTGRIDAIKEENSDTNSSKYSIFDWKTGKLPKTPETDMQTCVYLYSLYKMLKFKNLISNYEDISFTYVNLKDNNTHTILLNENKYKEFDKKISKIISNIKIKVFSKDVDVTKCYNCNHKTVC